MATPHAASGDLIDIHPFGDALPHAKSTTLVRSDHLEVMRLVLPAGKRLPQHQVPSVITVQCIEGAVELEVHGRSRLMRAGNMLFLAPGEPHSLEALEDSSILVSMLVHRE
jgi:quercetin dioxygenase-like cupin family protein